MLVALGLVSAARQNFDAAEAFFRAALERAPDYLDASLGLVRLALWRGDLAGARTLIDAITAEHPENTEARLLAARISFQEGETRSAEAQFQAILEREPDNTEALVGLGDAQRAKGDDRAARISYGKALALEPASADIQQRLAEPAPKKWRVDIGTERSDLTGGRPSWTDSSLGLSYTPRPGTTVAGRTRVATRYEETDMQIEARIDHAFSQDFSAYGFVAGTPDADFLARFSIGGGSSWYAFPRSRVVGAVRPDRRWTARHLRRHVYDHAVSGSAVFLPRGKARLAIPCDPVGRRRRHFSERLRDSRRLWRSPTGCVFSPAIATRPKSMKER